MDIASELSDLAGTRTSLNHRARAGRGPARGASRWDQWDQLESRTMMSGTGTGDAPLLAPTQVAVIAAAPKSVKIGWANPEKLAAGFSILRSENGSTFTQIAKITSAKTLSFTDATVQPNHTYSYEISAYSGAKVSDASSAVSALTPLATPSGLAASLQGASAIKLAWKDNDASATGYAVLRGTDGKSFSLLTTIGDGAAASYIDSGLASGSVYYYEIRAIGGQNTSAITAAVKAATPVSTPTELHATAAAASVSLTWGGIDPHAKSYIVMRSADGKTYSNLSTLPAGSSSYVDKAVATGTGYYYKIQAANGTSPSGTTAALPVTTLILPPTAVSASMTGTKVSLAWKDTNRKGMGYIVLRSSDGVNFTPLAQLKSGSAAKYVDPAVNPSQSYTYEVQAFSGSMVSDASGAAQITTPDGTSTVTITSRYGSELVVTAYGAADVISVSQSGASLSIVINGQTFVQSALSAGLFIYGRAGADTISIDSSVLARTTVAAIGDGVTTITSGISNLNAWLDSTDHFAGSGVAHLVGAFAGGVSKAVGAALANPKDAGSTVRINRSLFGSAPSADDVNQGGVGDCYFLSSLAAFAGTNPAVIQNSAVDMGDGTYVVQFAKPTGPVYVRVSGDLSVGGYSGFRYAQAGGGGIWAPIMEKAYAYFRTGANTFASLNAGWMGDVYKAFGVKSQIIGLKAAETVFYQSMLASLSGGFVVTFGTSGTAPNLVRGHAYTLISVSIDAGGVSRYTVRNPWGCAGDALENADGYATLTFAQMQANFSCGAQAIA